MKQLENFVKNTFKNYPKDQRDQLIESITEMLKEKVEDLIDKGYSEQDAIDKAVMEFGSIEDYEDKPAKINRKLKRQKTLRHYRNDIIFSIGGFAIITGILIFIDLYLTPTSVMWFVIPMLALLWWPLSMIYRYLNKRASLKGENHE